LDERWLLGTTLPVLNSPAGQAVHALPGASGLGATARCVPGAHSLGHAEQLVDASDDEPKP
jgi:hypothetical protein